MNLWTFDRTPWTGDSPTQGLYLHRTTQHRKTQTHTSVPKRDSNPRSQCLSSRWQYVCL